VLDPTSPDAYSWSPPADRSFIEAYDAGYLLDLGPTQEAMLPIHAQPVPCEGTE